MYAWYSFGKLENMFWGYIWSGHHTKFVIPQFANLVSSGTTQDAHFAIGDGFIVCDMGGGTVDLISYRVAELNPTIIGEATVGNADQCGGSFVDRAFLRWLEGRLGTTDFVAIAGCRSEEVRYTSLSKRAAQLLQTFNVHFKSGFSGTEKYILQLPPPLNKIDDDEARGIIDGEIDILP